MPRKKEELNKREKTILKFIEKQIMTDGYPPSVREIGQAVGLSSTATVHGYLERLEKKGYIKKKDKKGRTLRLLKGSTFSRNRGCSSSCRKCWDGYAYCLSKLFYGKFYLKAKMAQVSLTKR